jgi:hypothetical protein
VEDIACGRLERLSLTRDCANQRIAVCEDDGAVGQLYSLAYRIMPPGGLLVLGCDGVIMYTNITLCLRMRLLALPHIAYCSRCRSILNCNYNQAVYTSMLWLISSDIPMHV